MRDPSEDVEAIRRHLWRSWPEAEPEAFAWTLGDWDQRHPHFRVFEVPPVLPDGLWMYVSAGAAALRTFSGVGHEYVIRCRVQERLMVELLATVADYLMRTDHDGALHEGHTVPIGQPWIDGATADHLYVSEPGFAPPEFETLNEPELAVHFLWLVPVTASEVKWRHEHGQAAFERLLAAHEPWLEDPGRAPLI